MAETRILIGRPRGFLPFSSPAFVAPAFVVVDSLLVVLFFRDFSIVVVRCKVEAAVVASAEDEKRV